MYRNCDEHLASAAHDSIYLECVFLLVAECCCFYHNGNDDDDGGGNNDHKTLLDFLYLSNYSLMREKQM